MKITRTRVPIAVIFSIALAVTLPGMLAGSRMAHADSYFPQTGNSIWGPFETYWNTQGGLAQFGLPLTSVYQAGADYDAQWFERAVFTWNPNNPNAYKVELDLLGNQITASRRNEAPFKTAQKGTGGQYFAETGHNLSGKFLAYWQESGGLPIYGFPISEPFMEQSKSDGKTYLVQYFERNRFELHPELAGTPYEIELGLLGSELLDAQGGPSSVASAPKAAFYPPPASGGVHVPPGTIVTSPGAGTPGPGDSTVPPSPALPPTNNQLLFSSDFSTPDLSAWSPFGAYSPPDATPASWQVAKGVLSQSGIAEEEDASTDALLLTNDTSFGDASVDAYFFSGGGEAAGVVTRYGSDGYYALKVYAQAPNGAPKAVLVKVTSAGPETTLASSPDWPGYAPRSWYRLTLTTVGSTITASIDGKVVASASDSQFSRGRVGLYAFADGKSKFDNFRVTSP